MQFGEVARRCAFNTLDAIRGGKLNRLKETNRREITDGVTGEYAARRLQAILDYARHNCPFYADLPENAALSDFPVMDKQDFIREFDRVLSDEYRGHKEQLHRYSTSGSTGTPFTVYADDVKMDHVNMNYAAFMELNGYRLGMKRAEFRAWIPGKNTISRWHSFRNNLLMFEISNMGDEALAGICEDIRRKKVQVLVMYSTALTALTTYMKRKNTDISDWSVEMLFTMGEALPDETKALAEEIFGLTPVRSYGNNENGFMGMTLPGCDDYVIDLYNYHLEILKLDSDEPCPEGELGRIVITDLYNRAFPMIRYDIGDTGIARFTQDEKGRLHAFLPALYGRRASMLFNTNGEPLSVHVFMNLLLNFEGRVKQAKCIQWDKKRYEIQVNDVPGSVTDDEIRSAYRKYLGQDADIAVTHVDEIPVLASGKRMVSENRMGM